MFLIFSDTDLQQQKKNPPWRFFSVSHNDSEKFNLVLIGSCPKLKKKSTFTLSTVLRIFIPCYVMFIMKRLNNEKSLMLSWSFQLSAAP